MAKIKHNQKTDTINEIYNHAKEQGIMHITNCEGRITDRLLNINERDHLNFGSLSYLSLNTDERVIRGAVEAVTKYGSQMVMSRTYMSCDLTQQLELKLSSMFQGKPVLTYPRTTMVHISVMPIVMKNTDTVIYDQQAHFSMQLAAQLLREKGVNVEMIKHNNMEMLEREIKANYNKSERIWYVADGVFSMYGDLLETNDLISLLEKYPKLHLYVDDAHGMSWDGVNGTGFVYNAMGGLHPRMILVSTLSKGFGVHGGLIVFPDSTFYNEVKTFGGALSYSLPMSPSDVGASLASADIHLSGEIQELQDELRTNVDYANQLIDQFDIPIISNSKSPVFFIGMGHKNSCFNMARRLLDNGIYVNTAVYPAVSAKCSGIRVGLTRNHEREDILKLFQAVEYHYPESLEATGRTDMQVRRAFRIPLKHVEPAQEPERQELRVVHETSINNLDKNTWNTLLQECGSFDWDGLQVLEKAFSGNERQEQNWGFHYFIIYDKKKPIVATFFTTAIYKDDFLSLPIASEKIEKKRKEDPYYLTSKTLAMGSMATEGHHLYLDRNASNWQDGLKLLMNEVFAIQEKEAIETLLMRDFDKSDQQVRRFFLDQGFATIDLPNSNVVEQFDWETPNEFIQGLTYNSRRHFKQFVLPYSEYFEVETKQELTAEEVDHHFSLFKNVKNRNLAINVFDYPKKVLTEMSDSPAWEFITLRLKTDPSAIENTVATIWCHKAPKQYSAMVIGLDYDKGGRYNAYRQGLFQLLLRCKDLGYERLHLGFSADMEKQRLGATKYERVAFVQCKDNYNQDLLALLEGMS